jgi:nucleoside-diphosphate-sugar epimerase
MTTPIVLLTGVTGFLGGATAAELLLRHPSCNLLLLLRSKKGQTAESRIRWSLSRFLEPTVLEPALRRCSLISGDLTNPATFTDACFNRVTQVLHLAANTSFRSVRSVRQVNIEGTMALAHQMKLVPSLRRFLHVGTAYICGPFSPQIVHEDDYPRSDVRHLVEYTASKAECETLLEQLGPDLPLVIARPSVVVGHSTLGCLPSASIFWYYRVLYLLRSLPASPNIFKDIVPVDYAAKALALLLLKPSLSHRRYHISAGESSSVTWMEMMTAFESCFGARPHEPYRVVDFPTIIHERKRFREVLGVSDEGLLLHALEGYFRFGASGVGVFDNRRLLEEGMAVPPRFTEYLCKCAKLPPDRSVYDQMLDDF